MSIYLITYYVREDHHDCGCGEHDHEHHHHADDKLIMKIETLGRWAHFMPNGLLVNTSMTADEILEELKPTVGEKDIIFVSKVNSSSAICSNPQVLDWIERQES